MKNEELHKENVDHITNLIHTLQENEPSVSSQSMLMTGLNTLILLRICDKLDIEVTDIEINLHGEKDDELSVLIQRMPENLRGIS